MNAIIITAIWGIVMMFGGVFFKQKSTPKYWAIGGLILAIIANFFEQINQHSFIDFNIKDMLSFNSFNLTFITVVLLATLLLFLLK